MIAPAKISPPPPLQGRPPSHAQGMGPIHGPRSEAARRGSSPSSPTWRRLPPRGEPAEERRGKRKGRKKTREGEEKGVSSAATDGAAWSSRGLSVNGPRVPPKFEFLQKYIWFKPLTYSPRVIFHWLRRAAQKRGGGCNTRTSREVTHPSTTLAQARLTAEF
jgi:hypothetical protein